MFYSLTKLDEQTIITIANYYSNVYPEIPYSIMYERIYCGYCWGEGGSRILSIEDWYEVFNYTTKGKMLLTLFKDWNEYNSYEGDYHLKDTRFKSKETLYRYNLIDIYVRKKSLSPFSFRERISIDLGDTNFIIKHPKELYKLSCKELNDRISAIKAPWWNNIYEKMLKNNKKLIIIINLMFNARHYGLQTFKLLYKVIKTRIRT